MTEIVIDDNTKQSFIHSWHKESNNYNNVGWAWSMLPNSWKRPSLLWLAVDGHRSHDDIASNVGNKHPPSTSCLLTYYFLARHLQITLANLERSVFMAQMYLLGAIDVIQNHPFYALEMSSWAGETGLLHSCTQKKPLLRMKPQRG